MRERAEAGLDGALRGLDDFFEPPELAARGPSRKLHPCPSPYATAALAWGFRRGSFGYGGLSEDWFHLACDPTGLVRFFGPEQPIIGPDFDDTSLLWSERRAAFGIEPPESVLEAFAEARHPSGFYGVWTSPPEDDSASEFDLGSQVNTLAFLRSVGRPDHEAEERTSRVLSHSGSHRVYYPDPSVLGLLVIRARTFGADLPRPPVPARRGFNARCLRIALAGPDADERDLARLLAVQREDGLFPWAPAFVGGPRTLLPSGLLLERPWFGGPALSTAFAIEALASYLEIAPSPLVPRRAVATAAVPPAATWEKLLGALGEGASLVRRERATVPIPVLESAAGTLELEIRGRDPGRPAFLRGRRFDVAYRGVRSPTVEETRALERLVLGLDEQGSPDGPPRLRSGTVDASDVPGWLAELRPDDGRPEVHFGTELELEFAIRHLATAVEIAKGLGLRPRFVGLPLCALPWNDDWVEDAVVPLRGFAWACQRCSMLPRCPGAGEAPVFPRHSTGFPWYPLVHTVHAWKVVERPELRWAFPDWVVAWREYAKELGVPQRWSATIAVDVRNGVLDPTWRAAAFHRPAAGGFAPAGSLVPQIRRFLPHWPHDTDPDALAEVLDPIAGEVAAYPSYEETPDVRRVALYVDTDHLDTARAWEIAARTGDAIGVPFDRPEAPGPLLGLSVHVSKQGAGALDLYERDGVAVRTLGVRPDRTFAERKRDVPIWPLGGSLLDVFYRLGVRPGQIPTLDHLGRDSCDFTLRPTTATLREDGFRLYLKVQ